MFSCCIFKFEVFIVLKFKLPDGTEIGPFTFSDEVTGANLKSSVVSLWPKDKANAPKKAKLVDLFYGGKKLEDGMDLSELLGIHDSKQVITIKVELRSPSSKSKDILADSQKTNRCLICGVL